MNVKVQRVRQSVILALTAVMLTSCATIPDSGPVREGLPELTQQQSGFVFNPNPPMAGASEESIVRGFMLAASSADNNYEVAREYLTKEYAQTWEPTDRVLVGEVGSPSVNEGGVATATAKVTAVVDPAGTMQLAEPGATEQLRFELRQVGGEWRIASAPNGIVLDETIFTQAWRRLPVYFVSSDDRLVAESRWFVYNRSTLASQIMQALLSGPSAQMAQVLTTAFPLGTTLASPAVPVTDGEATIDLSATVYEADDRAMELMMKQVAASLQAVNGVNRFELSSRGAIIDAAAVSVPEDIISGEHQNVVVQKGGEFGAAVSGEVQPLGDISARVLELHPKAVTMTYDQQAAAVLHAGGVSWVADLGTLLLDGTPGLLPPSLDSKGYVWVYDPARPNEIVAHRPGGQPAGLTMPWLGDLKPVAVRVSMGGNRIAMLAQQQQHAVLLVAGIMRDATGAPLGFAETASIEFAVEGKPIDMDWINDLRFAVISEAETLGGSRQISQSYVGGFIEQLDPLAGASSISGGGTGALVRVLDSQGRLYQPTGGTRWRQETTDVELLAKFG